MLLRNAEEARDEVDHVNRGTNLGWSTDRVSNETMTMISASRSTEFNDFLQFKSQKGSKRIKKDSKLRPNLHVAEVLTTGSQC